MRSALVSILLVSASFLLAACGGDRALAPEGVAPVRPSNTSVEAPSGVTATAVSLSEIDVTWQDNSSGESGFELHRSQAGAAFGLAATVGSDVTAYPESALSSSTQYCYKVRALRTTGRKTTYGEFSTPSCTTTAALPPPAATGSIRVTVATTGFELDPDGYFVNARSATMWVSGQTPVNGTTTINGLVPGDYVVGLHGDAANCEIAAPASRTVAVLSDGTAEVSFAVTCGTPARLAFVRNEAGNVDIYAVAVNDNGTGLVRLTMDPAVDAGPAWSPDRATIAFSSIRNGPADIYVMNADGSGTARLTTAGGAQPSWSPDGTRIAFVRDHDIHVMDADGGNVTRLTTYQSLTSGAEYPAWSPDGRKIAFICHCGSEGFGSGEIYLMNADGSGPVQLTSEGAHGRAAWSPDGGKLLFVRHTRCSFDYCGFDLLMTRADGSGESYHTHAYLPSYANPAWSPDGRWIAVEFACYECTTHTLVAMRLDGSQWIELGPGAEPAWR